MRQRILFAAVLCAVAGASMLAASTVVAAFDANSMTAAQQSAYGHAVQSFREQRYAAAYGRFVRLADAGHVPSAQLALVMLRNGVALFGAQWDASTEQEQRWNQTVVEASRRRADAE